MKTAALAAFLVYCIIYSLIKDRDKVVKCPRCKSKAFTSDFARMPINHDQTPVMCEECGEKYDITY